MKKGFTTFLSALKANTPPCKKGHPSLRFLSIFLILFLAVGNAWGDNVTLSAADMVAGSTKSHITPDAGAEAAINSGQQVWLDGSTKKKYDVLPLSSGCSAGEALSAIKAKSVFFTIDEGYKISGLSICGASNKDASNSAPIVLVCWTGTIGTKPALITKITLPHRQTSSLPSVVAASIPDGTKVIALYRRVKVNNITTPTELVASGGSDYGSGYTGNLVSVTISYEALAPATKHTVTYDLNGGTGTPPTQDKVAENGTFTVASAEGITPPTGKDFAGWSDGTNTYAAGATYTMGTSDVELTAQWTDHVAKYTLIYKVDGVEVDRETVNVSGTPEGITAPTKDCYTFAGWSPALADIIGTDGAEVETNATWTSNYFTTSVDFETGGASAVSGVASKNIVASNAGSYDGGKESENWAYKGWKIKSNGATVKVLVQAGKKLTFKFGYLAATAHVAISGDATNYSVTGASKVQDDPLKYTTYSWTKDYDALYTFTTGSGDAAVIKALTIQDTYTATREDAKSDGAGSDPNVAETTLPTPTAVSGWTFTGWIANQAVKDGDETKNAGTTLPAGTYTLLANTTFTAQWALIADFDVKFFQGYGDPDVQIGKTQTISTGEYATAPTDPTRTGYAFLGWSYDGTEDHIVDVATYGITAATNFTAMWKAVWTVTFDGEGDVEVQDGETVASPNSPVLDGKVFQGWYNVENKYDFSDAVTGNLALTSKWADADANHYIYAYNDDFHFDGVVYKTPEGAVDGGSGTSNIPMTTPYTLFAGAEGITSIVMTDGIYDSKTGAIQAVTALMKVNNNATSKLTVTIKSGYTATLKIKSSGYSATRTINVSDATPASGTTTGQAVTSGAMSVSGIGELSFALTSGSHDLTVTGGTLYITELDIEATALPSHTVTYKSGDGTGDDVVDNDATEVRDGSTMFTAPEGKIFNGWKDESDNDVEVGAIVSADMALTAQWINHYAVTFNLQGHGDAIDPQDIKEGAKATKPADPFVIGWDFGGWFTDAECTAGNEFDFETPITAATPLYAKWTEFEGCALLYPATSGDALHVGDNVSVQSGSKGATIAIVGMKTDGSSIAYSTNGLSLNGGGADVISVTLNSDMAVGTKISVTLIAANTGSRGVNLLNSTGGSVAGGTKLGWDDATTGAEATFSYTVTASDGLDGTNIFRLQRNNSVYLKCLKVESCGAAITFHNLTSAVVPAGKGTVTLGAASVREGYTTTATYSAIDPLYEFVNWTVSGAGVSVADATANPATITVGTEDAVVTLNLQLIPVKFTVEYYDGATLMGSEQVAVNENPTASDIVTAKRHYTFLGWSDTDGGDVVDLNTITLTEAGTVKLYAKYEAVVCPTSGTIFSMEFDETKKPGETVTVAKNGGSLDLAEYATISGGNAMIINDETSGKDAISTDGEFLLKATKEVMKIELNCVLQEGDIIRIPDNSAKLVISTSNAKTGTYQAFADKNTHEFAVTAAWVGVDDIYVLYDGSSLKFTKVYVIRPAKYTVTFDMMGHGSAIADITNVIEGSKISAPTAPTDAAYSFAGWYKENTLANEWDFDNDVVTDNITLYAKWVDKSDATLKSLKYGTTEIALEAGVYTYAVNLSPLATDVPALTAVPSNPNATADVTNAAALDGEGHATSTVLVTPEEGGSPQTYTVNFTKLHIYTELADVTETTSWNWNGVATDEVKINDVAVRGLILANYIDAPNFEKLEGQENARAYRSTTYPAYQGKYLRFHATKPGRLTMNVRNSSDSPKLYVNGGDPIATLSGTRKDYNVIVPAGDVIITSTDGEMRIYNMTYKLLEELTPDYTRDVRQGYYGTICLPNGGIMTGAAVYEIAYMDYKDDAPYKIYFDEILNGKMEAGVPYIFLPNEGADKLAVFYTDEANESAKNANGLYGFIGTSATDEYQIPGGVGNYIIQNNQYREVLAGADARIVSNRAYIKLSEVPGYNNPLYVAPEPAPGRKRVAMGTTGAQVATGVDQVQGDEVPTKMIINGQLFILRGEKMYDAQGKLVR